MNRTNARKLILSNGLVASVVLFLWMVTSGLDVTTVYGATKPIPFTFDRGVFNITDLSIKEGTYSTDLIGFIQNVDPNLNTIKGTSLKIEMYDRNNHLIDVAESGYSSLPTEFAPQTKYAFKIPIDKNNDLDHLHIQILAQDWGTSYTYPNENVSATGSNSSDRPYMGFIGLNLTPDLSKHIGLNQTKGFLLTAITKGSPADKYGLRGGSNTTTYKGTDIDIGGDVILKIDNQSVSNIEDYLSYISQKHVGDKVHLTILRDNAIKELDVILGKKPNLPPYQPTSQTGGNESQEKLYNECVNVAGQSLCDFLFKR
jgi:hypothetical protein